MKATPGQIAWWVYYASLVLAAIPALNWYFGDQGEPDTLVILSVGYLVLNTIAWKTLRYTRFFTRS